ncbi:MAG TPA: DUF1844 domain-containing protein [Kofleriaceae bacterium]|nr:DUF1844 domain-containing protein [Kofleriaceae bacterium]
MSEPEANGAGEPRPALHEVDFATHVLSLASSAMVALGKMPSPSGEILSDVDTARYLIDVLGMLEHKTRGNLDASEEKLLQSLLYDLRVAFVDATAAARTGKAGPAPAR